jgi:predicted component of type VI protein secretion system
VTPIARPHWSMGLVLRPEHFRAMEEGLSLEGAARAGLLGLPTTGLARMSWDEVTLHHQGALVVRELAVQLPSGRLLWVSANAHLVERTLRLEAGAGGVARVFLHVHAQGDVINPPPREGEVAVPKLMLACSISQQERAPSANESIELARFVRSATGEWRLSETFCPPLIGVWHTPFLRPRLQALAAPLGRLRSLLGEQFALHYLDSTSLAGAQTLLVEVLSLSALLEDLANGVDRHPYQVYDVLRRLYFHLCFFQGVEQRLSPVQATRGYEHEALLDCYVPLLDAITRVADQRWSRLRAVSFVASDNMLTVELPQEVTRRGRGVSARAPAPGAVHRPQARRAQPPEAPPAALLPGVGLQPVSLPPIAVELEPDTELFRIEAGEEWSLALAEGRVGFYLRPEWGACEAALCWSWASASRGGAG